MESIAELKGLNGIIYLYEDRIVISRKTLSGIINFGGGERTLFYNAIQGIEYSGGMLRIIPKGDPGRSYSLSFADMKEAQKDSNCILLSGGKQKQKIAQEICEIIKSKVKETNGQTQNVVEQSSADEILKFKKLLDEGIITQEEFEKKKQELLK